MIILPIGLSIIWTFSLSLISDVELKSDAVMMPEEFTEETVIFGEPVRFCATVEIPDVDA